MVSSVKEPSCYKSRVVLGPLLYAVKDVSVITERRTQNGNMNAHLHLVLVPYTGCL